LLIGVLIGPYALGGISIPGFSARIFSFRWKRFYRG